MDQLRKVWAWLERQHFWVLTAVAVLVALGCWWHGTVALWTEYQSNRSTIEQQFSAAQSVQNKPFHANEDVQAAQTAQIAAEKKSVIALWWELYNRQTETVLKWPSNLSDRFRDTVSKLQFGDDIPPNLRAHYNNYVRDHFPELPKIVGALEAPPGQGGGFGRSDGGTFDVQSFLNNLRDRQQMNRPMGLEGEADQPYEEPDFLVIWADQDQQLVRDELTPRETPKSKRIWKTQEDLWVYEALLHIIADTNSEAGANRFSNAPVRVIISLEVGRTAAEASRGRGRIDLVQPAPAAGELGGMGDGMGSPRGEMERPTDE